MNCEKMNQKLFMVQDSFFSNHIQMEQVSTLEHLSYSLFATCWHECVCARCVWLYYSNASLKFCSIGGFKPEGGLQRRGQASAPGMQKKGRTLFHIM